MTRRHADQVEVLRRNDTPAHFLWRSRLYTVREVLAHWVETDSWWRSEQVHALTRAEVVSQPAGAGATHPSPVRPDPRSPAEPAECPELPARETWRVEASPGREGARGVYDLCFDWSAGVWTLVSSQGPRETPPRETP